METMSAEQLDQRINSFISRKHEQYPQLKLRPVAKKEVKRFNPLEVFYVLAAGIKWELGR